MGAWGAPVERFWRTRGGPGNAWGLFGTPRSAWARLQTHGERPESAPGAPGRCAWERLGSAWERLGALGSACERLGSSPRERLGGASGAPGSWERLGAPGCAWEFLEVLRGTCGAAPELPGSAEGLPGSSHGAPGIRQGAPRAANWYSFHWAGFQSPPGAQQGQQGGLYAQRRRERSPPCDAERWASLTLSAP